MKFRFATQYHDLCRLTSTQQSFSMLIDRQVKQYTISPEESVINALQKMCQTGSRMIFLTSESGVLEGIFTDGDLRLWLARQKDADLTKPVGEAANRKFISARATESPESVAKLFGERIRFIPLLDTRGRLVALASNEEVHLRIGDFLIDSAGPVFVIAEIGNNHNGDVNSGQAARGSRNCCQGQLREVPDAAHEIAVSEHWGRTLLTRT